MKINCAPLTGKQFFFLSNSSVRFLIVDFISPSYDLGDTIAPGFDLDGTRLWLISEITNP